MLYTVERYFLGVLILLSANLDAQNNVVPGTIRIDNTFEHIAIYYPISADDNLNSELSLEYKIKGAACFKHAAMSMRAHPGLIIDGIQQSLNYHAASACFLAPDTEYDLQLTLTDPDGGGLTTTLTTQTRALPTKGSNIKHVSPGNGGGNGTVGNPYLGLQVAANNASPGDHFIVASGNYGPFDLNTSGTMADPISFESSSLHGAIIDGANSNTGILTLGVWNDSLSHILIDGFKIQNGKWGVDAQNTIFLTIQNCIIEDVDYGIVNRRQNGWEHDQYFYNNTLTGRTSWPQSGIPSERGIDIRGNKNVVSFNTIKEFGDGISTDGPPYKVSYALDIHNNDIQDIVDDIIEVDGTISNTRVYNNRGYNGRMGVSVAPVFGGPCYIFRNQFYNLETSAYKMNRGPSGLVIVNNTSVKIENGMSSNQGWQNTHFRNNVIMGSRYCFEEYGLVSGSIDDWNYDAFLSTRAGGSGTEWFKWDNIRYTNVPSLNTSGLIEADAIEVAFSDFENISIPSSYSTSYNHTQRDLAPSPNSAVIDQGEDIDNLNDPYVEDGLTDMGYLENGISEPQYGADYTAPSCMDGIKNGDESYIDCGGSCIECNDCPYSTIEMQENLMPDQLDLHTSDWIETHATVPYNGTATLQAVNSIELKIGFETVNGAVFEANIADCN